MVTDLYGQCQKAISIIYTASFSLRRCRRLHPFLSLSLSLVSFRVLMIATDQKITTRKMAKEERTGEKKKSVNNNKSIVCGT